MKLIAALALIALYWAELDGLRKLMILALLLPLVRAICRDVDSRQG